MIHFIVLGAGAIGCYVGGRLAAAGERVTLVGRPRVIDPIAANGLLLTDLDGFKAQVRPEQISLAPSLATAWKDGVQTVILLCVKGGATQSAAAEIAAVCPAGTTVISLQNGVENLARISRTAPQMQALAGMVPYNVVLPGPGRVHRATAGVLQIARSALTEQILPRMLAAGLPAMLRDDMVAVQWGKLLLNLNNPVNALSDQPLREQLMNRDYRRVLAAMQLEALAALRAAGIVPAKVAAAPPKLLPSILQLPDWLFKRVAAGLLKIDASARSSMWDDLQRGRTTEIDDLCGAVVRLGARHGVPTPCNAAMQALIAAHQPGQRYSGSQLRDAVFAAKS